MAYLGGGLDGGNQPAGRAGLSQPHPADANQSAVRPNGLPPRNRHTDPNLSPFESANFVSVLLQLVHLEWIGHPPRGRLESERRPLRARNLGPRPLARLRPPRRLLRRHRPPTRARLSPSGRPAQPCERPHLPNHVRQPYPPVRRTRTPIAPGSVVRAAGVRRSSRRSPSARSCGPRRPRPSPAYLPLALLSNPTGPGRPLMLWYEPPSRSYLRSAQGSPLARPGRWRSLWWGWISRRSGAEDAVHPSWFRATPRTTGGTEQTLHATLDWPRMGSKQSPALERVELSTDAPSLLAEEPSATSAARRPPREGRQPAQIRTSGPRTTHVHLDVLYLLTSPSAPRR